MRTFAFVLLSLIAAAAIGQVTNAPVVSHEARTARMNLLLTQGDLDGNGKLDHAEKNLLRSKLKERIDPVRKRVVRTNAPPNQVNP